MDKCKANIKRVPSHLTQFHHLDKTSALYKCMISLAKKRRQRHQNDEHFDSGTTDEEDDEDDSLLMSTTPHESDVEMSDVEQTETANSNPRCQLPTDFLQFTTWLQTPDGRKKCEKSAKQHAFQVKVIYDTIVADNDISCLWSKNAVLKFLSTDKVKNQFLPPTVKSYLGSLRHFYTFLLSEESDRLNKDETKLIEDMNARVARWISSYRKDNAARCLAKMEIDLKKLITPEQFVLFDRSEPAIAAIKYLGELSSGSVVNMTQTEYNTTRDFLLVQLVCSNANRSGILSNMTVTDFKAASKVKDSFVVTIADHKTKSSYGSANLVLSPSLLGWIGVFITYARSIVVKLNGGKSDCVFLSWNCKQLPSGQITRAIQSVWKKAGLGEDISCTIVRKSAVTSMFERCPEQTTNLADLMLHSTNTQSKTYRCVQKRLSSVAASTALTNIMKMDTASSATLVPGDFVPAEFKRQEKFVWSDTLLRSLRTVFDADIKSKTITFPRVQELSKLDASLATIDPRKIYDRLRQECNKVIDTSQHSAASVGLSQNLNLDDVVAANLEDNLDKSVSSVVNLDSNDDLASKLDNDSVFGPSIKSLASVFNNFDAEYIRDR